MWICTLFKKMCIHLFNIFPFFAQTYLCIQQSEMISILKTHMRISLQILSLQLAQLAS